MTYSLLLHHFLVILAADVCNSIGHQLGELSEFLEICVEGEEGAPERRVRTEARITKLTPVRSILLLG